MIKLDGKVCLITGSCKGIGAQSALMMSKPGARVIVSDVCEKFAVIVCDQIID